MTHTLTRLLLSMGLALCAFAGVAQDVQLPGFIKPETNRWSGGALDAAAIQHLKKAGVKHVIDLRTPEESVGFDEAAALKQAGVTYERIAISGAQSLTVDNARRLDALLNRYGAEPTLVHCASGNRVGALMAVREAWLDDASTEQAIALGRRWGLTKLEPSVRALLSEQTAP